MKEGDNLRVAAGGATKEAQQALNRKATEELAVPKPARRCFQGRILGLCVEGEGEEARLILKFGSDLEKPITPDYPGLRKPLRMAREYLKELGESSIPLDVHEALLEDVERFEEYVRKALLEYARRREKLRVHEYTPPTRARVYIKNILAEFAKPIINVWQDGRLITIGWEYTPAEIQSRLTVLQQSGELEGELAAVELPSGSLALSREQLLEEWGIDPGRDVEIQIQPVPYLFVYETGFGQLLFSRNYLGVGDTYVRLYPMTPKELKKVLDSLDPDSRERLIIILARRARIGKKDATRLLLAEESEKAEEILEKLVERVARVSMWAEKGASDKVVDYFIRDWPEILRKAREGIELDPLIQLVYEGLALPFFDPNTAPHMAIFTPTNAGKTLMYRLVIGEDPYSSMTSMTLAGGILPDTRRPIKGVVHGRRLALQIEGLEAREKGQVLQYALDYMKSGRTQRGAGGRNIISEGSGPLVFTGNTVSTDHKMTLQTLINEGLLENPEALGSRLILFYARTRQAIIRDLRSLQKYWEIIREIRDNETLVNKLRRVWEQREVREWLEEKEALRVNIPHELGLESLVNYLEVLAREFAPRLKALALNRALLDYLHEVWTDTLDTERLLETAAENYEALKGYLVESILNVVEDFRDLDLLSFVEDQPSYLKVLISVGLRKAAELIEPEAFKLSELTNDIREAAEILQRRRKAKAKAYVENPYALAQTIKKRLLDFAGGGLQKILAAAGISVTFEGGEIYVKINPEKARKAAERLHEYI